MAKKRPEDYSGPGQPLLPVVNLAKLLVVEPTWCGCDCKGCPPWVHPSDECSDRCVRMCVPPASNTGVHTPSSAAASSFWERRDDDPRSDDE